MKHPTPLYWIVSNTIRVCLSYNKADYKENEKIRSTVKPVDSGVKRPKTLSKQVRVLFRVAYLIMLHSN